MKLGKITICGKEIMLKGSGDAINHIAVHLRNPLRVTSEHISDGGYKILSMFSASWTWDLYPDKKPEYDRELAAFVAALMPEYTARTPLPDTSWADKYIPTEQDIAARREAAKSPEVRERERIKAENDAKIAAQRKMENDIAEKENNAAWDAAYGPALDPVDIPLGYMGIYVEHCYNDSDAMTDYYHPHKQVGPDMLLGIVREGPETEATARRILARYTSLYGDPDAWKWHTEKYSGGHGNYLTGPLSPVKVKVHTYSGKGWAEPLTLAFEVRYRKNYGKPTAMRPYPGYPGNTTDSGSEPTGNGGDHQGTTNGIRITRNLNMGGIEIRFPGKPTAEHIETLRGLGFRYSFRQHINYARYSPALWERVHEALDIPIPATESAEPAEVNDPAMAA